MYLYILSSIFAE